MLHKIFLENSIMYSAIEASRLFYTTPFRGFVKASHDWNINPTNLISHTPIARTIDAVYELLERITRQYPKPEFGIKSCVVNGQKIKIKEEIKLEKDFCNLVHFKKSSNIKQPKLLIVAPMSGHYATLCRGTVEGFLDEFDVYITDWKNVRDVPLAKGTFGLDDFIDYCIEFFRKIDEKVHVLAVCQPAVPVSAAIAILSDENSSHLPKTMTLIGGPIDARINPTEVNLYAERRPMYWFEDNVITRVPINYSGFMRAVYPGFIQLAGFMSMNMKRHVGEHLKLFEHLVEGDGENSEKHKKFYDEYLAVMDLPAEFYLETIQAVFKDYSLPRGNMVSRGRAIKLESIKKVGLHVVEGENDDITGLGQTKAAIDLCTNIPSDDKEYTLHKGVGHYGLFNGSAFRKNIVPNISAFIHRFEK